MTIAKTTARVQYAGDGATVAFSFPYRFFEDTDLQVYLLDSGGTETLQTLTTNYTVSNTGTESGGTVTMATAPASGETLTILRSVPLTQSTDYQSNDSFPAESHETGLDRLTLLVQQLGERVDRALALTASDSASVTIPYDRASKYLAFDASKVPIAATAPEGGNVVSAFMATVLDDADATTARTTLGAAPSSAMQNLVEDVTPQLGGPLDTNSHIVKWSKGADVASANALTLGADGNYFDITGTTTITSIGTLAVGTVVKLHFDGALTLTHHATDLILPGGANITTAAGDEAEFVNYASGDWRCTSYTRATGKAVVETVPGASIAAWVQFNGTGTPAINGSYNVSSITDLGVGNYRINFTNNLAHANFAAVGTAGTGLNYVLTITARAVGSVTVDVRSYGVGAVDGSDINVIVIL